VACSWFLQDKISSFWGISKRELEGSRAELRNREREVEDLQEEHHTQLKACSCLVVIAGMHATSVAPQHAQGCMLQQRGHATHHGKPAMHALI
jgi:hypothetical protein